MPGKVNLEFCFCGQAQNQRNEESEMRFYLCGNFSGQNAQADQLTKAVKCDMDNFDAVLAKFSPTLQLGAEQTLVFNELDDFHPDRLINAVPLFSELLRLKHELADPQTAARAADEIWKKYQPAVNKDQPGTAAVVPQEESMSDTLDRLFERDVFTSGSQSKAKNTVDELLQRVIAPLIVPDAEPEHQALSEFVKSVLENLLNAVLHNPEFQALESLWRSVYSLLFNEEADENTGFYLVNISKKTLAEELSGAEGGRLANLLLNHGIETVDSIIVGNFNFADSEEDLVLLSSLGKLAGRLKSRFLAAADQSLVKDQILARQALSTNWQTLRQSPEAAFIGLCYPRVLLRLPYGKKTELIDAFGFEEFRDQIPHEQLLWGNPAFAWARVLVRQYTGYECSGANDIDGLPQLVTLVDDEKRLQACAEWYLSEQQIQMIFEHGIMPFISFHNRNSVRLFAGQALKA